MFVILSRSFLYINYYKVIVGFLVKFGKNMHSWVFQKRTNCTRPSDSCNFVRFWKTHSCMFFPNCTRNHTITYTYRIFVQAWAAPPPRYGNWKVTMELENYQRKFTKLIKGLEDLSSEIDLGLTTLERRTRRDLIEIFKIESDFVAYDQHMFRKGSSGRQFLLTPASSSQDPFKCRSTMLWNGLPLSVRTASSVTDLEIMLYSKWTQTLKGGF